jgi:hypothetical protein
MEVGSDNNHAAYCLVLKFPADHSFKSRSFLERISTTSIENNLFDLFIWANVMQTSHLHKIIAGELTTRKLIFCLPLGS